MNYPVDRLSGRALAPGTWEQRGLAPVRSTLMVKRDSDGTVGIRRSYDQGPAGDKGDDLFFPLRVANRMRPNGLAPPPF